MTPRDPLPAFAAVGLELEYMIVDRRSLDVRPAADRALSALAGRPACDVARGPLGWSNELVAHVIELKNLEPSPSLAPLADAFQREIAAIGPVLAGLDARLMPTGMHPWMHPRRDTVLWSAGDGAPIYRAFDRLFDCRRHGWANLQSMHVNLPFAGDDEFRRLHAAIRVLLPIVPALAASSPIADGRRKRALDYRLDVYRENAERFPSIAGRVVPEAVATRADYEARILAPMYAEIAPHDPQRVLRHEWLNSRGAIARFERSAIEIRLADVQECPRADVAIAGAIVALARALYAGRWRAFAEQDAIDTGALAAILAACVDDAERARIDDAAYLALFGLAPAPRSAGDVWRHALAALADDPWLADGVRDAVATIVERGPLARRILRAAGGEPTRERLHDVYGALCDCLAHGVLFDPG